jgi:hypothetical protein
VVGRKGQSSDGDVEFPPQRPFGEPPDPAAPEPLDDDERPPAPDEARLAGCRQAEMARS